MLTVYKAHSVQPWFHQFINSDLKGGFKKACTLFDIIPVTYIVFFCISNPLVIIEKILALTTVIVLIEIESLPVLNIDGSTIID